MAGERVRIATTPRRPNNRQIMGARHYLADVTAQNGKLARLPA